MADLINSFYNNAKWRRIRIYILEKYRYICSECGDRGNYVHHIDPLTEEDYKNRPANKCYGEDNLRVLCFNCHEIEHNRATKFTRKGTTFDVEGNLIEEDNIVDSLIGDIKRW